MPRKSLRRCRVCGCTDRDCTGCVVATGAPCSWVERDLCSACDPDAPISFVNGKIAPYYNTGDRIGYADDTELQQYVILRWAAHFSCQRREQGPPDDPPCAADSEQLCVPCAAAVFLGLGRARFAENIKEYRSFMRPVRHFNKEASRGKR